MGRAPSRRKKLKPLESVRAALAFFLLFPFLVLIFNFSLSLDLSWAELWWALKNSFLQSLLSSFISIGLGFFVALGFFSIQAKWLRAILEIAALLPSFLPAIFTLIAIFNFIDPFPMGIVGIVIVHSFINFGLMGVLIANQIESRLGGLVEQAWVDGVSRFKFYTKVFWPLMKKDLAGLFLFVFALSFSSFSVPLVVGGGRGTTLEVLIYEKIRLSSDWGAAVLLSLIQSAIVLVLSWTAVRGRGALADRAVSFQWLRSRLGLVVLVCLLSAFVLGYAQGLRDGFSQLSFFYELRFALLKQLLGTLQLGLAAGILTLIFLFLVAWARPQGWFQRLLSGYFAPSTALTGFAFLVLGPNTGLFPWIKIPLAMVLLNLTSLYRMSWEGNLRSLESQRSMAEVLGASHWQIFSRIEVPQLASRAGFLAGVAALWTAGDFAVSRILAHNDLSLSMMTETLLSSYRISQASVLSFFVFIVGISLFLFFVGAGRVLGRKFKL